MKYFALLDTEGVVLIGEYKHIFDAMDDEPAGTHWVLSEAGLRELKKRIEDALND